MRNGVRCVAATVAFLAACIRAASADPIETSAMVTVNALTGQHQIGNSTRHSFTLLPLPLGEVTLRSGTESLRVEGIPPATFSYKSVGGSGADATRLSIANATVRHSFAGGWFGGAGQTIYNQFTNYASVTNGVYYSRGTHVDHLDGSEGQYSRVTGARFELGRIFVRGHDRVEVFGAVNPRMRGVQYTRVPTSVTSCGFGTAGGSCSNVNIVNTYADPENASQVDITVRIGHGVAKGSELVYGLRYLNYTAHYDAFPGLLADRNVGFAPLLGYRIRL